MDAQPWRCSARLGKKVVCRFWPGGTTIARADDDLNMFGAHAVVLFDDYFACSELTLNSNPAHPLKGGEL